jgi:hypothetical protein
MELIRRLKGLSQVKPLGDLCTSTSGFGGKSDLILTERTNKRQIAVIKGDCIGRYETKGVYWFDFCRQNITGRTTDRRKLGAIPKVLLRKTGSSIVATYDDTGIFPEQSLYFLFENRTNLSLKFILGVVNSRLLNRVFRAKCLTNKDSIAQVKKIDLDALPIRTIEKGNAAAGNCHERMVALVDKMLALVPKLRMARTETERATLRNAVAATDGQIDALVYELYDLTPAEIALVEKG